MHSITSKGYWRLPAPGAAGWRSSASPNLAEAGDRASRRAERGFSGDDRDWPASGSVVSVSGCVHSRWQSARAARWVVGLHRFAVHQPAWARR